MDFFHRKEYSFETPEIKNWFKHWLKSEKWSITELVQFLQEKYKLETPIYFSNHNAFRGTIDCTPATGKPISLQYCIKFPHNQVRITAEGVTHCYNLKEQHEAVLEGRITKAANGSFVYAKYRYHDYTYKQYENEFDSEYHVRLFITDAEGYRDDPVHRILTYTDKIETYLLNFEEADSVSIYRKVCELIGFDYKEIDNIHISYNPPKETEDVIITEIEAEYGHIVSCKAREGLKWYEVKLGDDYWSWEYIDPEQDVGFNFMQERINNTDEAKKEIEDDIREEGGYEINPEKMGNVLSEITQSISSLLEIMG